MTKSATVTQSPPTPIPQGSNARELITLQISPSTGIGSWFHGTITQRLGSSNAPNLQMRGNGLSYACRNDLDVNTSSTSNIDVLIVGAGPTGLVPQPRARHVPLIRAFDQAAWLPGSAGTAGR
jgi:hypothetical protein